MTVLERLKELVEKRKAAADAYDEEPSMVRKAKWQYAVSDMDEAVNNALPHLIAVAEAAQSIVASNANAESGWRVIAAALAELTKGAGDER